MQNQGKFREFRNVMKTRKHSESADLRDAEKIQDYYSRIPISEWSITNSCQLFDIIG